MSAQSAQFILALVFCALGLVLFGLAFYLARHQEVFFDSTKKTLTTQIDIPLIGKIRTNAPAIALAFLGLVPLVFAYNQMKNLTTYVTFDGQVDVDPASIANIGGVVVGVTSGEWSPTLTADSNTPTKNIAIRVPDSWPSYSAYAFALGKTPTRPQVIGLSLADPKFRLRVGP